MKKLDQEKEDEKIIGYYWQFKIESKTEKKNRIETKIIIFII